MAEAEQRQVQIRIDETRMNTTYANTIRTTSTLDEVILDFGLNLPVQAQGNQPTMVFAVGSRVVLNWSGAKRLAQSLNQLVASYEKSRGEINLNPQG
ncbi:MAG: DUF3467 domain-containing protein [Phycisphaerales bacterium]|nr:DUF3467 domain-containing protein [Phycisphaerales bacterium]